jgi:antitoxin MazE
MKTKIVRIGNSRGVRIPKPLLEQAGLQDEVELRVVESGIIIEGVGSPRAGWAEAAEALQAEGGGILLDEPVVTDFEVSDWVWE